MCGCGFWRLPAATVVIEQRPMTHEERCMDQKFGDAFPAYRAWVRRWIQRWFSTTMSVELGEHTAATAQLEAWFDAVVVSGEFRCVKPDLPAR